MSCHVTQVEGKNYKYGSTPSTFFFFFHSFLPKKQKLGTSLFIVAAPPATKIHVTLCVDTHTYLKGVSYFFLDFVGLFARTGTLYARTVCFRSARARRNEKKTSTNFFEKTPVCSLLLSLTGAFFLKCMR